MTDPMQTEREALSNERILQLWDIYVGYESAARSARKMPLTREDKLTFAREVLAASELRSLRDALQLAKSRIAELEGGDAWVLRLRRTAADLRENSLSLAKYPDMGKEARARELAALYIKEIADLYTARAALKEDSE